MHTYVYLYTYIHIYVHIFLFPHSYTYIHIQGSAARLILLWTQPSPSAIATVLNSYISGKFIIDTDAIMTILAKYDYDLLHQLNEACDKLYDKKLLDFISGGLLSGLSGNFLKAVQGWLGNRSPDNGYEKKITVLLERYQGQVMHGLIDSPEEKIQVFVQLLEKQNLELRKFCNSNNIDISMIPDIPASDLIPDQSTRASARKPLSNPSTSRSEENQVVIVEEDDLFISEAFNNNNNNRILSSKALDNNNNRVLPSKRNDLSKKSDESDHFEPHQPLKPSLTLPSRRFENNKNSEETETVPTHIPLKYSHTLPSKRTDMSKNSEELDDARDNRQLKNTEELDYARDSRQSQSLPSKQMQSILYSKKSEIDISSQPKSLISNKFSTKKLKSINETEYEKNIKIIISYISDHFLLFDKKKIGMFPTDLFWIILRSLPLVDIGFTEDEVLVMSDWCEWDHDGFVFYKEILHEFADSIINAIDHIHGGDVINVIRRVSNIKIDVENILKLCDAVVINNNNNNDNNNNVIKDDSKDVTNYAPVVEVHSDVVDNNNISDNNNNTNNNNVVYYQNDYVEEPEINYDIINTIVQRLIDTFHSCDYDHNGFLDYNELGGFIKIVNMDFTVEDFLISKVLINLLYNYYARI